MHGESRQDLVLYPSYSDVVELPITRSRTWLTVSEFFHQQSVISVFAVPRLLRHPLFIMKEARSETDSLKSYYTRNEAVRTFWHRGSCIRVKPMPAMNRGRTEVSEEDAHVEPPYHTFIDSGRFQFEGHVRAVHHDW
ncbi:hypothetical protein AcV7_004109 [Taiwanofungus camphoratus]|nr:hypothetical protein AcV7_004109 [Antrodia cinnamomea]